MNEERREILRMIAEGKISVDEADMLLDALADTSDNQEEATTPQGDWRKCCGTFFGDFDFKFDDFGEKFANFENIFSNFGDMFVSAAKQKNRRTTCQ